MPRFVIHQHFTKQVHFDLRMENNGSLKSWAFLKEPSPARFAKNFGAQLEDQPSSLLDFEGEITENIHGTGNAKIWDRGECEIMKTTGDFAKCGLKGGKIDGIFKIVKTHVNDNKWLMMRTRFQESRPSHNKQEAPAHQLAHAHQQTPVHQHDPAHQHTPATRHSPVQQKPPAPKHNSANRPDDAKKLFFSAERNDSLIFALFTLLMEGFSERDAFALTGSNFHFGEKPIFVLYGSQKVVLKDDIAFKIWQVFKDNNITPERKLFFPQDMIAKRLRKICELAKVNFNNNILELFQKHIEHR
ncbi:MAG: hypothetical protein HZA48_09395 [Planctomycetes bacterium]|nr:hypothetical protein [Planctomycetota bacterium]